MYVCNLQVSHVHTYVTEDLLTYINLLCGPIPKFLELQLGDTDQPLKIMYSWKKLLSQYGGKGEGEIPTFHLRRNVFSPPSGEKMVQLKLPTYITCISIHP